MAAKTRGYKKNQLSKKDRSRLFITGSLCTLGAILLCIEGWISWIGSALYLAGLVNWLVAAFFSEKLTVVDHSEFTIALPTVFIWLVWGKVEITMNGSYLVHSIVFSLMLSALFIAADWYKQRRSSFAQYTGWSLLTIFFVFFLIGIPFLTQTNVQLDPYEEETYVGMVVDIDRKTSAKSTTKYYADVSFVDDHGYQQQKTIRIKRSQYQQITAGETVTVIMGHGLYGAAYWMIDIEAPAAALPFYSLAASESSTISAHSLQ